MGIGRVHSQISALFTFYCVNRTWLKSEEVILGLALSLNRHYMHDKALKILCFNFQDCKLRSFMVSLLKCWQLFLSYCVECMKVADVYKPWNYSVWWLHSWLKVKCCLSNLMLGLFWLYASLTPSTSHLLWWGSAAAQGYMANGVTMTLVSLSLSVTL